MALILSDVSCEILRELVEASIWESHFFFICDGETFKKHTFCFIEIDQQKMFSKSLLDEKTQCKQPM